MPIALDAVLRIGEAFAQGVRPPLTPEQLSSYIAVNGDGTVSAFLGKTDMGQGLFVAIGQMVAEELDVPFKAVTVIMGDTASSVNQGGASGSTGIQRGGRQAKVDESSIKDIPGTRVVWEKGFLGVVADNEWDAIRASQKLKVEWSDAKPPFPDQAALYDHIRSAAVRKREVGGKETGNVDEAFKTAARVIEAEYEWPFQSHASMGPACAVVEIKDGQPTLWTGTQKPHYARDGIAAMLGMPAENVRAIWVLGPGSYGRNDADDCAADCAVLAKAVGKPVRLQYMREQGTGWDPKGPASTHKARAALDAQGNVIAYEFSSKAFSRVDVDTNG